MMVGVGRRVAGFRFGVWHVPGGVQDDVGRRRGGGGGIRKETGGLMEDLGGIWG